MVKVNSSFDIDANQSILGSSEFKEIDVSSEFKDKSKVTVAIEFVLSKIGHFLLNA